MTEQKKPSFWTRAKWIFTGKPVSHEEAQAARSRPVSDPITQTQFAARDQRFGASGLGM